VCEVTKATIYHNPRCSKSRQTLELLREREVETTVVLYLTDSPDRKTLRRLLGQLSMAPIQLVRKNDHRKLGLEEPQDDEGWLDLMVAHPAIIERPIVVVGDAAVLGRPPENILKLLA
jgi:arsenate reductase